MTHWTLLITCVTALSVLAPRLWIRNVLISSTRLQWLALGGVLGMLLGHLVPELFELGGYLSLFIMAGVWALHAVGHKLHFAHHDHEHADHTEGVSHKTWFLISMSAHNFATGYWQHFAESVSLTLASTSGVALIIHKAFEGFNLGVLITDEGEDPSFWSLIRHASFYVASFPLGALASWVLLHTKFNGHEQLAQAIGAVAVGSLLGCVVQDALQHWWGKLRSRDAESLKHLKAEVAWVLLGAAIGFVALRFGHQ